MSTLFLNLNQSKNNSSKPKPYLYLFPAGFSGCAWWRFRLPFNKLIKLGSRLDIGLHNDPSRSISKEQAYEISDKTNIVGVQSPGDVDALRLIKQYKTEGKKVVIDYDDFSFDLSPYNPRYHALGTKETTICDENNNPKIVWRDQENEFDVKLNTERYNAFTGCVASASCITTTTNYLANKFREKNQNVKVCPNSIDFELWKPVPRPDKYQGQIRMGWFGGDSHYGDLKVLKSVLKTILDKYPKVVLVLQAPPVPFWTDIFQDIPKDRIDWKYWVDLKYYTLLLANRHFDIGLCPLEDTEFNRCKSNIKTLEFAALKVPVVATNMTPYNDLPFKHMDNILLAKTDKEWVECLSKLIEDQDLRNQLANRAFETTKKYFDMDKNCYIWENAYLDVLDGVNERAS